jgi:hypothetical protein
LGPKGLVVVGVTNEGEGMVAPDVTKKKMKFPIAIVEGAAFDMQYGVRGFPSSFLIGAEGEVLWAGHPSGLDEEFMAEQLAHIWMPPAVSDKNADIAKALGDNNLAKAWKALDKALTSKPDDAELKGAKDALVARVTALLEQARTAESSADFAGARRAYQQVVDRFGGVPEAEPAKAAIAALGKNKEAKLPIEADDKLRDAFATWRKGDLEKGLKAIRAVAKKYAGTEAGKRAQAIADLHEE